MDPFIKKGPKSFCRTSLMSSSSLICSERVKNKFQECCLRIWNWKTKKNWIFLLFARSSSQKATVLLWSWILLNKRLTISLKHGKKLWFSAMSKISGRVSCSRCKSEMRMTILSTWAEYHSITHSPWHWMERVRSFTSVMTKTSSRAKNNENMWICYEKTSNFLALRMKIFWKDYGSIFSLLIFFLSAL